MTGQVIPIDRPWACQGCGDNGLILVDGHSEFCPLCPLGREMRDDELPPDSRHRIWLRIEAALKEGQS